MSLFDQRLRRTAARAIVVQDIPGVRIAVLPDDRTFRTWQQPDIQMITEDTANAPDEGWLRISDAEARALYEALADHFGHAGHDTRALRKDYDAERGRVDKLIAWAIGEGSRP